MLFSAVFGTYGTVLGTSDGPTAPGVRILSTQEVGNYETTVITGDSANGITEWLKQNGFPDLGNDQQQVVQDYLGKHWVFLCAKLKVVASGVAAIHPLTVRFPSSEAIYPMRLTQGAGTVPVSLYCVHAQWMSDPSDRMKPIMATQRSLSYRRFAQTMEEIFLQRSIHEIRKKDPNFGNDTARNETPLILEGRDIFLDSLLIKTNITHLEATFGPESNWDDIRLVPSATAPAVPRHMTLGGLFTATWGTVWWIMALCFVIVCILYGRSEEKRGWRAQLKWFLAAAIALMLPVGIGMIHLSRNSVIVSEEQIVSSRNSRQSFEGLLSTWLTPLETK
jgi:hypothetical protein